jgi:hypothetical protein
MFAIGVGWAHVVIALVIRDRDAASTMRRGAPQMTA